MRTFTKDEVSWVLHRMLDSIKKGSLDSEGGHWAIEEIYRPMIEALIIIELTFLIYSLLIGRSIKGPVVEVVWVSGLNKLEDKLQKIKDDNSFFVLTEIVIQER